jgi:hypothetical protein
MKFNITHFLLAVLLAMAVPACGQIQGRYYMVGSFSDITNPSGNTYQVTMTMQADQSGLGYLASQITAGMRVLTNTRQQYSVETVGATTFGDAELTLQGIGTTNTEPIGIGVVYAYDPTKPTIPVPPANSQSISQAMMSAILTHNAEVAAGGEPVDYGRIRYVNRVQGNNATAAVGDPTRPWQDLRAAIEAGGFLPGDVVHTYNSEYSLEGDLGGTIVNPPDDVTFSFDNVAITSTGTGQVKLFEVQAYNTIDLPTNADGTYDVTMTGNLRLTNSGSVYAYVDDQDPTLANGDAIPEININVEVGSFNPRSRSNVLCAVNGSSPAGVNVSGVVDRVIEAEGAILSTGFFETMRDRPQQNQNFRFVVRELEIAENNVHPALWLQVNRHILDNSQVQFIVARVKTGISNFPTQDYGSKRGQFSRLFTIERGAGVTNSTVQIQIDEIAVPPRGSALAFQGDVDYSDVVYSSNTFGDNPRMARLSGDLTGSYVDIECRSCVIDDGFILLDQPQGGEVSISGNIYSREQSVIKMNQSGTNSGNTYIAGTLRTDAAPVISSASSAPDTGTGRTVIQGTLSTTSGLYPVITTNRPITLVNSLLSRRLSSGGRPALESNDAATTSAIVGGSYYFGAGNFAGPNISVSALKTAN